MNDGGGDGDYDPEEECDDDDDHDDDANAFMIFGNPTTWPTQGPRRRSRSSLCALGPEEEDVVACSPPRPHASVGEFPIPATVQAAGPLACRVLPPLYFIII